MVAQLKIEAIGSKLFIEGERGAWDVVLHIRLAGQDDAHTYPVRLESGCIVFSNINHRDNARNVRDRVQIALILGEAPVYAQLRLKDRTAVVSFRGLDFQTQWRIPRNASLLVPRWQADPQTTNQEKRCG